MFVRFPAEEVLPVEDKAPGVFYAVGCHNRASMSRKRRKCV